MLRAHHAWLLVASAISGCSSSSFACHDDGDCGAAGTCEVVGYCSFADAQCPSRRRFGQHATNELAGMCVPGVASDASTSAAGTTAGESSGSMTTGNHGSSDGTTLSVLTTADSASSTGIIGGSSSATGSVDTTGIDTGAMPIVIGPLVVEDNGDDGALWPAGAGLPATWYPDGESPGHAFLGAYPLGQAYYGYMRFHLPQDLPPSTIVLSASLELTGYDSWQWDAGIHALRVWAENQPDAAQVDSVTDYPGSSSVTLTSSSVRWPAAGGLSWNPSGTNTSPDLTPLIQELVDDHGGMAAGAHVQLWVTADDVSGQEHEVAWLEVSGGAPASLVLEVLRP